MIIAVNIEGSAVGGGLGRARMMVVARVEDGVINEWTEVNTAWDESHPQGSCHTGEGAAASSHGSHHARIVTFMKENAVEMVVTGHAGPPMVHTLSLMGIPVVGATGDAREAVLAAATGSLAQG
jgi:predicted Fe-Mo cluster-binding NifX family protein